MTTTTGPGISLPTNETPPVLSQRQSIEGLLNRTKRSIVPIRKTFVQQGKGRLTRPGPLATFLTSHDNRGLECYFFVHAMACAVPWNCVLPSGAWVRVLGLEEVATPASARSAASKIMRRLEDRKLIKRSRSKRRSDVRLLREDGSGEPYARPIGKNDPWLQLPYAYWLENHFLSLSLRAKVVLLIALSLDDDFYLPAEKALDWYGVSADSVKEGLRELRQAELLDVASRWVVTPGQN